jgi:D-serine deaminase-like pyridoxal phosphate-dependent protein
MLDGRTDTAAAKAATKQFGAKSAITEEALEEACAEEELLDFSSESLSSGGSSHCSFSYIQHFVSGFRSTPSHLPTVRLTRCGSSCMLDPAP